MVVGPARRRPLLRERRPRICSPAEPVTSRASPPRPCSARATTPASSAPFRTFLRERTRLGIPAIIHEESCAGFTARGATQFPQAIGLASTWEPELIGEMAAVIRSQMRAVGARQTLAPVLDIARDPRWGRTEETFGEDPYLASRMGVAYVRGIQTDSLRDGVVATGKHFMGYGASEGGLNWAPAPLPRRELLERILPPFAAAIREAGLASVMNAYQEIDGIPCGASRWLLDDLLRGELGFDGVVVADYYTVDLPDELSPHRRGQERGRPRARSRPGSTWSCRSSTASPSPSRRRSPRAAATRPTSTARWRASCG